MGIRPKYVMLFGHYTWKIFQHETFVKHGHWFRLETTLKIRG